jgi:hypothetical protein
VKTLDGYFNIKPSSKKKKNVAVVPQLQKKRKTSKASPKKDMSHIIRQLQQQVLEVKDEGKVINDILLSFLNDF